MLAQKGSPGHSLMRLSVGAAPPRAAQRAAPGRLWGAASLCCCPVQCACSLGAVRPLPLPSLKTPGLRRMPFTSAARSAHIQIWRSRLPRQLSLQAVQLSHDLLKGGPQAGVD